MFTTSRLGAVCYYVNDVDRTEAFTAMCSACRSSGWRTTVRVIPGYPPGRPTAWN